jgi:HNH endonuclease
VRLCGVEGCGKPARQRGWCSMHYARWRKHGDPLYVAQQRLCAVDGCGRKHYGHGWCGTHYARWRKHGDPLAGARVERLATCTVDGCGRKHKGHGYCQSHLRQLKRGGLLGPTRACSVDGCESTDYYANGLCSVHYQRARKHGDPLWVAPVKSNDDRFLEQIERDDRTECWNWTGLRRAGRYGVIAVHPTGERHAYGSGERSVKTMAAHRWAFERWVGPIPYGHHVHHVCRNPLCANPDHLKAISPGDHWRIPTRQAATGAGRTSPGRS